MYIYDKFDQNVVDDRVGQFRNQTLRYLKGDLSEDEFRPLRLKNGLYEQRLAPMLRVAIPYGVLSSQQLRKLAYVARQYDKGYGHFSTRQNIQYNWPKLEEVPDLLADLAQVQMHAIQTSGNCIRNVTADQFSGVSADEIIDGRPVCELIRQWSTFHPEFDWLPRKFKIAVNGASIDRTACRFHDIGIEARFDEKGEHCLDILVGGGLGRTPIAASLIKKGINPSELLCWLESILRIYNRFGRRDNKYKARIKILVRAMTPEKFTEAVDDEFRKIVAEGSSPLGNEVTEELQRITDSFKLPALPEDRNILPEIVARASGRYKHWLQYNLAEHKVSGYAIVNLSLKEIGVPPGDATDIQMDAIADLADKYSSGEIRVTHEQNLVLPYVRQSDLEAVYKDAVALGVGDPVIGTLSDVICCPGGDFCSLANAKSIPVTAAIQEKFENLDYLYDLGPIDLNISGCVNACGHHHVGHIGILGVDKKGKEFFQISLGGDSGVGASIGKIIGPSFAAKEIPEKLEIILKLYLDHRNPEQTFLEFFQENGIDRFKKAVYGSPS